MSIALTLRLGKVFFCGAVVINGEPDLLARLY
jgi:hypothetical protein